MTSSRIFVRGLPPNFSHDDFRRHFSKPFETTDVRFIPHRRIGYVGYKTSENAAKAVKFYNKSFVRMSRIGVELARSVEEQNAPRPGANATIGVKRKHGNIGGNDSQENALGAQARHGNEDIPAGKRGSRLQEFLTVMQPPSKSKMWEDQAALAAQVPKESVEAEAAQGPDAKSDEEYEAVPKRQRTDHGSIQKTEHADSAADVDQVMHNDFNMQPIGGEASRETAAQTNQGQSDPDWLRSRTSRLLGLMDDDDAPGTVLPLPDDGEAQQITASEPPQESASGDMSDKDVNEAQEAREINVIRLDAPNSDAQELVVKNGRLFIRNLAYSTTEDDLQQLLDNGKYGAIKELHLSIDSRSSKNKGFAHVQFVEPQGALSALSDLDQKPFQGRLLHVMPADAKKETGFDEFAISNLPLKKQQQIKKRAEATRSTFSWNSMYMSTDAIMSSISDRLNVAKSELLDPTSSDAAIRQAHAETHIIQETKSYLSTHGVNLDAFKRRERGDSAILIKNFAYGSKTEELKGLFEPHGRIKRLLMPPSGTIAIVEFNEPDHARSAFNSLAYKKFKDSILFLEKAPKGLFSNPAIAEATSGPKGKDVRPTTYDLLEKDGISKSVNTLTLFIRNLNFRTTSERLREVFQPLNGFLSARVKTKADAKKPGHVLSMGFGFLEFRTKQDAQAAQTAMDGYKLDGHNLLIRASHRAIDAAEERRNEDKAKKEAGKRTKIIIKNLPFEASRKDIRSLLGSYGQLRSVRVPKKLDSSTRGFAFAEFVTAREAENAMDVLRDTHLLGRRLVLEFAAGDALDPEEEIERMQQKVGKQADKVALQQLTGSGRMKFNVDGNEELDQG